MVDVAVNFTLEDDDPVSAEFQVQPDVTFTADIKTETGTNDHDKLNNRELPDQHPISAITGLEEALEGKVAEIIGGSNIDVERTNNRVTINSASFIYEQGIASDVWVIEHNLNKAPAITLVDSSGAEFQARKVYNSLNQVTIYLNGATTGKAYLN